VFTFRCVLRTDGSFRFEYGALSPTPGPSEAVVGYTTGSANRPTQGTPVSFATLACPGAWGNGEAALFEVFNPATNVSALSMRTICFNPTHQSGRLTMWDDDTVEVALSGWTFPFHGNRYTSFWVGSNGYVTFGGGDRGYVPSAQGFVNHVGRVAALYTDLNPGAGGEVLFTQSPGMATVSWSNVPYYAQGGSNSFSITLNGDGSIILSWGSISNRLGQILVGLTGGYPATTGSEAPMPLAPGMVHGSGPGAVFDLVNVNQFLYANNYLGFDNAHAANASAWPLGDDDAVEVMFPAGFTFPFGTGRYYAAFFHTDGYVSFGGSDARPQGLPLRLLSLFPRICGAWTDLTTLPFPPPEGRLSVAAVPGSVTFQWSVSGAQFSIRLNADGSFVLAWGAMSFAASSVVGYSTGGGTATGAETPVAFTTATSWGTGRETAIYQAFPSGFPLAQRTLNFAAVGPILWQRPITSPGTVPVAFGAGAADAGLVYLIAASLGSQPGIAIPGCGTIPLNFDPILVLTMSGAVLTASSGTLDGLGVAAGWPAAIPSPVAMLVPAGLAGRGIVLHLAFVTIGPPGPCRFRTISSAVPFRI
jgi:hypothetical protein